MIFELFCGLISLPILMCNAYSNKSSDAYHNLPGYGTEWMYFPDGDDVPHRISLEMPPEDFLRGSNSIDGIEFRLYTRYNPQNYVLLDDNANPIDSVDPRVIENFNKIPTKLVTHGWESTADKHAVMNIKNAYLETMDVNVIAVDWSSVAESILYPVVAMQTSKVGKVVGEFIDALNLRYNVSGSQLHLIGHSLGAHVMGNAGSTTKHPINQITGLDPARPLFEFPPGIPNSLKLDTSDAVFVDIIHTCSGLLGVMQPIGHADFYPNDGLAPQPGCDAIGNMFEACSHSRSHFLYGEAIRHPFLFPAYPCKSWLSFSDGQCPYSNTFIGENVNRSAYGTFYLSTNKDSPYGRGI